MSASFNFQSKNVFITGGSQGIGEAIVKQFAVAGANIVFTYCSQADKAQAVIDNLSSTSAANSSSASAPIIHAIQLNSASIEESMQAMQKAIELLGGIDYVINNAADTQYANTITLQPADFQRVLNVNLLSPFFISQVATKFMIESKIAGVIVNISSILSAQSIPNMCAYSASKAALEASSRALAIDLAAHNIRCVSISPGLVATPNQISKMPPWEVEQLPKFIPTRRFATADEIAKFTLSICADTGAYINGVVLPIDGGLSIVESGPLAP